MSSLGFILEERENEALFEMQLCQTGMCEMEVVRGTCVSQMFVVLCGQNNFSYFVSCESRK